MAVPVTEKTAGSVTKDDLHRLVEELPDGELLTAGRFLQYLRACGSGVQATGARVGESSEPPERQVALAEPPFRYATVTVPASTLRELIGIMPDVGGDALADSEALYDGD